VRLDVKEMLSPSSRPGRTRVLRADSRARLFDCGNAVGPRSDL